MTKILLIQCSEVLGKMLQYINIWNEVEFQLYEKLTIKPIKGEGKIHAWLTENVKKKKNIMDIFHDQDNSIAYIAMQQQR